MQKAKNIAAELFKTHPTVDTFFVTSDEQAFFTDNDAIAHSRSLKDTNVAKVTRDGETDVAGVDLTTKVVYVDENSKEQIEALKEEQTVKVMETALSGSEKEANDQAQTEKTEESTQASQLAPPKPVKPAVKKN